MRFVMGFVLVGLLVSRVALAQQYKPGDQVVVIQWSALRVPAGKVDEVWRGLTLKVEAVKGQFLWVNNGKPGWLDSANVLPLGRQAVEKLTELIQANPKDSELFTGRADCWEKLGDLDMALQDHNEAIRLDPRAYSYLNRGLLWYAKKEIDRGISDFDEAIRLFRLNPDDTGLSRAFNNRANGWEYKGEFDKAIADYNESIRADPKEIFAYQGRGKVWREIGEYGKALVDLDEVVRIDPKRADFYNTRAWLSATCPDPKYRDGRRAVEDATKACEINGWNRSYDLGTLAAAYAEAGDFAKAIEYQEKANGRYATNAERETGIQRLALYREKKPYREELKAKAAN